MKRKITYFIKMCFLDYCMLLKHLQANWPIIFFQTHPLISPSLF